MPYAFTSTLGAGGESGGGAFMPVGENQAGSGDVERKAEIGDLDHRHLAPTGRTAKRLARIAKSAS